MKNLNQYIKEQEDASHDKEIESLIKSVGGGTKSAGVFESWVHIVCSLSGKKTEPTVAQVKSASNHSEFHP